MKLFRRARLLGLSAALALAGASAVVTAASPAYASPAPHISAFGGPMEIWVYGYGFPAGAKVRVEALSNPGLKGLDTPQYTTANSAGDIDVELAGLNSSGPAYVLADLLSPYSGTVGAQTVVLPPPGFLASTGQPSCGSLVMNVDAYGFMPYYNVRVEVLSKDLFAVLGSGSAKADGSGMVHLSLVLSDPYLSPDGALRIVADEYGYGPLGFIPAPATVWSWVFVC
jgi:hypothetical protein